MNILDDLERLEREATPAPWTAKGSGLDYPYIVAERRQLACGEDFAEMPDALLVCSLRNHARALISVARAAAKLLDSCRYDADFDLHRVDPVRADHLQDALAELEREK